MTRAEIEKLIPLIPADEPMLYNVPAGFPEFWRTRGLSRKALQREIGLLLDPEFAWKFTTTFSRRNRILPSESKDVFPMVWLQRVNSFQLGYFDGSDPYYRDIAFAVALKATANEFARMAVDSLLLVKKETYEEIGKRLKVPGRAIRMYEQLFWNVRDRIDEETYIGQLIYPKTRAVEAKEDYLYTASPRELVLRHAHNNELEDLLHQLGILNTMNESKADEYAKRFEARAMHTALHLQRSGGGHGPYHSIVSARQMIQSAKMGGQEQQNSAESELSELSVKFPVMETLKQLTAPALERMLAFEQAKDGRALANVGEQDGKKEKAVKGDMHEARPVTKPEPGWQKW